ncbi:late endosomal/lysosomal adaptor and MAPK and MTOR activator-domain-containing protein [Echria macrotheca]|uniref:Late endosomal/lysosomal adaptor and MAPK and MTOR activator-domain-containing protein n=1 Tax=Echria macrotheca TaxID=438768 RepID=A0AAJ0FE06_9PEZI|nr:late endosomal/lysosomal adaptor and MAPK and MTOR activator-domain-containing protein [Echria macrotheca]
MGNCSSCVGQRRRDSYDEEDEAQHLFDDPNNMGYGSFDQQHMAGVEDPQEVQREIEALQRVVARTSDNMVDIYDIVPQDKATTAPPAPTSTSSPPTTTTTAQPYAYANQLEEPHLARYQTLLSKLSSHEDLTSVACVDWGVPDEDDGTIEMQQSSSAVPSTSVVPIVPVKLEGGEALVGNFADAAAAMR